MNSNKWHFKFKYAGLHLLATLVIGVLLAILVFVIWYPYPYSRMVGGLGLYSIVLIVDVVCGPLLTFILSSPNKERREFFLDISLVVFVQLSALFYGLFSVYQARPVAFVFELDRFRVVSQVDLYREDIHNSLLRYQKTSLFGIKQVAVKRASSAMEADKNLKLSLQGIEMSMRQALWLPYDDAILDIKKNLRPLSKLSHLTSNEERNLENAVNQTNKQRNDVFYIPIVAPMSDSWIALLDKQANILGYANVNSW